MKKITSYVLLFVCITTCAYADSTAVSQWWHDHGTLYGQIMPLGVYQEPSVCNENPDNAFMQLERESFELHVRPTFCVKQGNIQAGLQPRYILDNKQFVDGSMNGQEKTTSRVFINEGYVQWALHPSWMIGVKRKNEQWGNGFLTSPSNPFYRDTGKTRPDQELGGKDFVQALWFTNDVVSLTLLANIGQGEYSIRGSREPFHNTYALKAEMTYANVSLNPVISYEEHGRLAVAGYGTWTASDAVLLFFDMRVTQGNNGRYAVASAQSPFGLAFEEAKDTSQTLFPQTLIGGSYSFLGGPTVYGEYLYSGIGYTADEEKNYQTLVAQSHDAFLDPGNVGPLKEFARQELYYAYQHNLVLRRRNYCMVYATYTELWNTVDDTAGIVYNADDTSFYVFQNFDYKVNDVLRVFCNVLLYSNIPNTEYQTPLRYLVSIGVKYFF